MEKNNDCIQKVDKRFKSETLLNLNLMAMKERTSVERVNAYLKEYFQLNNVRYRSGELAKVHVDLLCLLFNASKLAVDRINTKLNDKAA
jgi:hypothetical protein